MDSSLESTKNNNNGVTNRYTSNKHLNSVSTVTSATTIEDLYKYFGILADAKQRAGDHTETFLKLVSGTKGGPKEKQLASQFITRFFKFFPKEMSNALESIFDLCEDEDVNVKVLNIAVDVLLIWLY